MSLEKHYDIIRGPIVTEKSTQGSMYNQVTFRVDVRASKPEIKKAVEELFKVEVAKVNTLNQAGKTKRFRGRLGQRNAIKKAIVTLKDGHTIDVTSGV